MGLVLLFVALTLGSVMPDRLKKLRSRTPLKEQLGGAAKLASRILPKHGKAFTFEPLKHGKDGDRDAFEIEGLTIRATSGVAAASGLHYYLRTVCHASIHWGRNRTGFNVDHLPKHLPRVKKVIRKSTGHTFRYYFNAVTFGYSAAWWDETRWQEELDWAALHSVNLFLALEGQEYVWEKLWLEMGVDQADLNKYFPGPSFLAWHRMGNLDTYMGPEPKGWRKSRYELQKKIVQKMRSIGMIPVLTAFAGHIPEALERKIKADGKSIKIHRGKTMEEGWCGFEPTTLLDASDPLFPVISKRFLELQKEAFGTDHVYSCDTFNEMQVPFTDEASLRASSKAVIDGMMEADPDAVWLMQGWLFLFSHYWWPNRIEAYLSGVPNDRMIVLDLFAEKRSLWDYTESFHGKPWIWCQLLNFGGNSGLFGNMTRIAEEPSRALKESPSFAGTGMSMEAIERNPILFSMLADTVWTDDPIPVKEWLALYASSRFRAGKGKQSKDLIRAVLPAFQLLNRSVYHFNGQLIKPPMEERPKFWVGDMLRPPLHERYQPQDVATAFGILVEAAETGVVAPNGPFLQDVTDVGRQMLVDFFTDQLLLLQTLVSAMPRDASPAAVRQIERAKASMLTLLDTLDEFLGANINFMLGPVLHESPKEAELQVRNILTLWGDGVILNDYAAKEYSSLVKNYYKKRWEIFLDAVIANKPREAKTKVMEFENNWFKQSRDEADEPSGDTLKLARKILDNYAGFDGLGFKKVADSFPLIGVRLHQAWTSELGLVKHLCEMTPDCGGFTSTGMLFMPSKDEMLEPTKGIDTYVRLKGMGSPVLFAPMPAAEEAELKSNLVKKSRFQPSKSVDRPLSPADEVLLDGPPQHPNANPRHYVKEESSETRDLLIGLVIVSGTAALLFIILRWCCCRSCGAQQNKTD